MAEDIKKEDGRVRYTKMRIRSAFYELIQEMPYEKITVTAICNRAEINRATFYKHYLDVPDLVDKLQELAIDELAKKLEMTDAGASKDFIIDMLKIIKKNLQDEFFATPFSVRQSGFTSKITSLIYEKFSGFLNDSISPENEAAKGIIFAYVSSGSAGIIDYWIKTDYKDSEELIAGRILQLTSSTVKGL